MACCSSCGEGKACEGDVSAQGLITTGGLIVPGICGPFGIVFPLRIRARVGCAASRSADALAAANAVLGSSARTAQELPQPSVAQAVNILARTGVLPR